MNTVNMMLKTNAPRAFIITDLALVRLDLIVNTVNVTLKMNSLRALIIT